MGAGRGATRKGGMGGEDVRKQAVVGELRQCTDLKAVLSMGKWRFKTEEGLGANYPFMVLFCLGDCFGNSLESLRTQQGCLKPAYNFRVK